MTATRPAIQALAALLLALGVAACGDGQPNGDGVVVSPDTPVSTTPGEPPGRTPPLISNDNPEKVTCTRSVAKTFDATSIIGQSLEQATTLVEDAGCSIRVIERDGQVLALTEDFSPTRVNVVVEDGRVTDVDGLY